MIRRNVSLLILSCYGKSIFLWVILLILSTSMLIFKHTNLFVRVSQVLLALASENLHTISICRTVYLNVFFSWLQMHVVQSVYRNVAIFYVHKSFRWTKMLHAKIFSDSCWINRNQIVFTIPQLIGNQTEFHLVPDQSENGKDNLIPVDLRRIRKDAYVLCVYPVHCEHLRHDFLAK